MTEPLPCPFCGHVGVTHNEGSTFRWLTTMCITCGAQCGEERIDTLSKDQGAAIEQAKEAAIKTWNTRAALEQQAEPVSMRMPKVGDRVICLEDESFGEVVSLTGGGSPDITFDDGTRGTYLLREFAELFGYAEQRQQQAEPVAYFDFQELKFTWAKHMKIGPVPVSIKVDPMKLYSEAPQRPWVGLTDEEIEAVVEQVANGKLVGTVQEFRIRFSRAIEAKLKERNT